jgi:hypothetical protein
MNEEPKDRRAYSVSHSNPPVMLDIRATAGEAVALPYSYLELVQFNPSVALVLTFATCEVRIEGQRLFPVYEAIVQHVVAYIQENDAKYEKADDKLPFIERIEIKPLSPETKFIVKGFKPGRERLGD